ncbi:hypothetical protein [Rummeliibacillus stabekisii]|uniref:hypothetical protein n=1 Tax=Rummeliibacillus stabekisii TaxID=241244 RepID=UPI00371999E4
MKIIVKGITDIKELASKLEGVANTTALMLERDNPDVKINGFSVVEAEVSVKYDIEGYDEPQMITVNHGAGSEIFTWVVDGNETENNKDESLFDDACKAIMRGEKPEFKEVQSEFKYDDLLLESSDKFLGMRKDLFTHKDGFKVVQVFQEGKLIQEYILRPKEKE